MQVKKRLRINVAISVITACVVVVLLMLTLSRVNRAREESEIANEIQSRSFERNVLRNDYLRYGSERAKVQWYAKAEQISKLLASASVIFSSEDRKIIDTMITDQESAVKIFTDIIHNREKKESGLITPQLSQEIEDRLITQQDMRLYERVLSAQKLRESASEQLRAAVTSGGWGIVLLIGAVAVLGIFRSFSLERTVTSRVSKLREGAVFIGEGNLAHRIDVPGDDEFAQLSRAFNAMAAQLRGSYAELQKEVEERKRSEAALRESHERLKKVLEVETVGVMFWDLNTGRMTDANDTFLNLMGYSRSEVEAGELTWQKLTPPEYMDVSRAEVQKFLATGRVGPYEKEYLHKDGTRQWFVFAGSSLGNNTCVEFCVDISSRKKAEEALRESEERFRVAQELSPDGFLIFRPLRDNSGAVTDFLWIYENDAAARMNDTDPKEIFGKRVSEVLPHHDESPFHKAYKEVAETGEVRVVEEAFYDHDTFRQRRWFRVVTVPTTGGDVAILVQNVTERKRAEEVMSLLAALVQSADDAMISKDLKGNIKSWNIGAEKMYGYTAEEAIGRNISFLIPPGHINEEPEIIERIKRGEHIDHFETIRMRKDGTIFPVLLTFSVIREAGGRIIGVSKIAHDITQRKHAEEERDRLITELKRSNTELEQFAYVASHDLQEPLRMVASYMDLLKEMYQGRLDEKADKFIGYAVDGAVRMQKLVEGLLAYSRISRKGGEFRPVDLNKVFSTAVSNLSVSIKEGGAEIETDELPRLSGDETQLTQLFQNLIGNAVKYRRPGASPRIRVSAKREGENYIFSVSDNGIGIEPRHFDKVFQIFQRLHTRNEYSGTGIGLALCKRIVERHHGRIWIESVPGEGSTFFFTMPVAQGKRMIGREKPAAA